ncbi:hypothetical protein CVU75_01420 [Candidatus Dependentiae bacterium HGW-Dependentiae-1]|nr:MAG: hypothetical protein CVU75_01420 [Candidatus Dependentiae bacterium HGW-Dependentiae-1]
MDTAATTNTGWVASVKETMSPDYLMKKFDLTSDKLINIGLYLAAGFFAGFLLKKYAHVLFTVAMGIAILAVLHYSGVITVVINWDKLQALGLGPVPTVDATLVTLMWEWAKIHVAVVLSFIIGFLIGLKVG